METIVNTSNLWLATKYKYIEILDYDGWDRMNFHFSFYEELITFDEFNKRLHKSTLNIKSFVQSVD